jgi:hypothetical protein
MSRNQKYLVPDLRDAKTMQESIKRVRYLLMERGSNTKRRNSNIKDGSIIEDRAFGNFDTQWPKTSKNYENSD